MSTTAATRSTRTRTTRTPNKKSAALVVFNDADQLKIYDRVFLGDKDICKDADFMVNNQITHVLNVSSLKNHFEKGVASMGTTRAEMSQLSLSAENDDQKDLDLRDKENNQTSVLKVSVSGKGHASTATVGKDLVSKVLPPLVKQESISLSYLKINIDDSMETDIKAYFDRATQFIHTSIQSTTDGCCLVHCKEGKSRSVTMLIAYGMKHKNMSLKTAYDNIMQVTDGRPRMNDGFKRQLMEYELELMREAGVIDPVNTLDFFPRRRKRTVRAYDDNGFAVFVDGGQMQSPTKKTKRNVKATSSVPDFSLASLR